VVEESEEGLFMWLCDMAGLGIRGITFAQWNFQTVPGLYAKRDIYDCGNPRCGVCHREKFSRGRGKSFRDKKMLRFAEMDKAELDGVIEEIQGLNGLTVDA
jgi:hypothetical protein